MSMLKFFRVPFALSGTRTPIPDAADPSGLVSYIEGYGADYQRAKADPLSKNIERDKMNELFFDVTNAIAELQSQGIPNFITTALNGGSPYSYAIGALVRWTDNQVYSSTAAANTTTPADLTKWSPIDFGLRGDLASSGVGKGAALVEAPLFDGTTSTVDAALAELRIGFNDADGLQAFVTDLAAGTAATMACFGDSTMWGAEPSPSSAQVANPPPAQIQSSLNNYHGNAAATVTNNAISGTSLAQMLAGTDGSGSTFAAKMAVSAARVVACNHGVNDAFGGAATTPAVYRANLTNFIRIVRAVGKTPLLITPWAVLTIGVFGSQARAEATQRFAQIMREVAQSHGVPLVDQNNWFRLMLDTLQYPVVRPLDILPDGVHGNQATYNMGAANIVGGVIGAQSQPLTTPDQIISAASSYSKATTQTFSEATSSRAGVVVTSGTGASQSMRIAFVVDKPGFDLVWAYPIFSNGSGAITVNLDGVVLGTINNLAAGFTSTFWFDYETLIARNIRPGAHVLTLTGNGGIGLFYLRARAPGRPVLLPSGSAAPNMRQLLAQRISLDANGIADTKVVCDNLLGSFFTDALTLEFTATLTNNSGLVLGGNIGSPPPGTAQAERAITIGINGSGFVTVWEATAPNTYTVDTQGVVNLAGVSHVYRVNITTAGVLTVFVDNGGSPVLTRNLTGPYKGGLIGAWRAAGTDAVQLNDVCRVWGL